jgi:hypothetical protein
VRLDGRARPELVKWQRPDPDASHAFIEPSAFAGESPSLYSRPVPTSNAKLIQRASLGNIHFELPVDAACGYTDPLHLVVCLDVDYRISAIESLRLLAFAADPLVVRGGSERALTVVNDFLSAHAPKAQVELQRDDLCSGDCDRRITLEVQ